MMALYETIRDTVPAPQPAPADPELAAVDEKNQGFSMLVSQLDRLPALGPTVTGKIHSGRIFKGDKISCKSLENEVVGSGKVKARKLGRMKGIEPRRWSFEDLELFRWPKPWQDVAKSSESRSTTGFPWRLPEAKWLSRRSRWFRAWRGRW